MTTRNTILFLCVANSARSQMAEGWARALAPDGVSIESAGSRPARVHPHAIAAMREVGIDLRAHHSKSVHDIDPSSVRFAVTLCADEVCPPFTSDIQRLHWPHEDPAGGETLDAFRSVRDQIGARIRSAFATGEFATA